MNRLLVSVGSFIMYDKSFVEMLWEGRIGGRFPFPIPFFLMLFPFPSFRALSWG